MTKIITHLGDISAKYDTLFCDLWGCIHNGLKLFQPAIEALKEFRARKGEVIFITNSSHPAQAVMTQLASLGLYKYDYDALVTAGDCAQHAMLNGAVGYDIYHIGTKEDKHFFTMFDTENELLAKQNKVSHVSLDMAEGIICTGLVDGFSETPEDYHDLLQAAQKRRLKMLCANPDIVADVGDHRLWCAGALAHKYEMMGGEVLYFGKPHKPIYELARQISKKNSSKILCIGDGITTDIKGGNNAGLDTLFIAGGLAAGKFGPDADKPDVQLLESWFEREKISSTYTISHLK